MNNRIAKLIYQSKHRGCKENDILLGRFSDKIKDLSSQEVDLYEQFLCENDTEIYNWLCGTELCPDKYQILISKIL